VGGIQVLVRRVRRDAGRIGDWIGRRGGHIDGHRDVGMHVAASGGRKRGGAGAAHPEAALLDRARPVLARIAAWPEGGSEERRDVRPFARTSVTVIGAVASAEPTFRTWYVTVPCSPRTKCPGWTFVIFRSTPRTTRTGSVVVAGFGAPPPDTTARFSNVPLGA